jgi:hypothetical protein
MKQSAAAGRRGKERVGVGGGGCHHHLSTTQSSNSTPSSALFLSLSLSPMSVYVARYVFGIDAGGKTSENRATPTPVATARDVYIWRFLATN